MPVEDPGNPPASEAQLLRRLEAELTADPGRGRRLARYRAQMHANPDGVRPPTGRQLIASALVLGVDGLVLAVAVRLNSGVWLAVALLVFVAAAVPLCVPPRWARPPRHRRARSGTPAPSSRRGRRGAGKPG
jgi:hypothetical protein